MKVRAKWNIKDENGWHFTGEEFEAKDPAALGEAVEPVKGTAPDADEAAEKPARRNTRKKDN